MVSGIHIAEISVMIGMEIIDIAVSIGEPAAVCIALGIEVIPVYLSVPPALIPAGLRPASVIKLKPPALIVLSPCAVQRIAGDMSAVLIINS